MWLQFIECFVLLNSIKIISQRVFSLQMVWIAGKHVSGYDNNDNKYHKLWVHLAQSDMYMTLYFEMSLPCTPPSFLTFCSSSCFLTILEPFNLPNSMNSLRQLKSNSFWRTFVTYFSQVITLCLWPFPTQPVAMNCKLIFSTYISKLQTFSVLLQQTFSTYEYLNQLFD